MKGIKGKNPAFQFYVKDWLGDPQLRAASVSTRGIWIDVLCFMWDAPNRGIIETTKEKLARMTGATMDEICLFFDEAQDLSFCDISVTNNGMSQKNNTNITLCNRRMWREEKDRRDNKIRQARHREKRQSNRDVTPSRARLSSSSSSSSKKIKALSGKKVESEKSVQQETAKRILSYLNLKTEKHFKNVPANIDLIKARLNEGFQEKDFKTATDNQVSRWKGDAKMEEYLRPSTLFQKTKMDAYVNAGLKKDFDSDIPPVLTAEEEQATNERIKKRRENFAKSK